MFVQIINDLSGLDLLRINKTEESRFTCTLLQIIIMAKKKNMSTAKNYVNDIIGLTAFVLYLNPIK
jgi:hypothetical protein